MPDNVLFVGPLDRVLALKTLPAFADLSSRALVVIAQKMRERFIRRGAVLVHKGQRLTASYFLVDGSLEISAGEGPHVVESGDAVGLLELLAGEAFPSDIRASVDSLVFSLDAEDQEDIWEDHFLILLQYIKYLAKETLVELRQRGSDGAAPAAPPWTETADGTLNLVERILALHRVPILSSESIDAVAELSGHLTEIRVEPGERLWHEGESPDHFWIVVSGTACSNGDGTSSTFESGPGDCLGLEEVLADEPRWNDTWAVGPLLTLRFARERFIDVLEDHFPMARHVIVTMARRLLELRRG